jgi:cell division protein FtsB
MKKPQKSNSRHLWYFSTLHSTFSIPWMAAFVIAAGLIFAVGCENAGTGGKTSSSQQVQQLTEQKADLQKQLEQARTDNDRLRKQVEGISSLPGDKRVDAVYHLQAVKIGRFTNLYDNDKDGTKEKLIVYVQPIDETGDVIKAAGAAEVQLWDLNKKEGGALLAQWRVEPNEIKKLWFNSIAMTCYRLTFDVSAVVKKFEDELTVTVTFTDYLSGSAFTDQFIIRPEKAPGTQGGNKKAVKP